MGHAFHECPKRRKACVAEYTADAMNTARIELARRKGVAEHKLTATEACSEQVAAAAVVAGVVVLVE